MINLFKFDIKNNTFSVRGSNSCQTPGKSQQHFLNYNKKWLDPFIDSFNEGKDVYEICITIKPQLLDYTKIGSKTHLQIFNLIEKKIRNFLKKYRLTNTKILLISEYSESLRLHFHGVINKPFSPEMADNLRQLLCKYIGRTVINLVRSKNYFDYITKDTHKSDYTVPQCMII